MKKKYLLTLLFPIILTSCGNSGVSFKAIKNRIDGIEDTSEYPYYRVIGKMDFNKELMPVDATFDQNPGVDTFVPYSRYNDGFYNAKLDKSEPNKDNVVIYGMASKSYFLRAPLRLTKENFYTTVALDTGTGSYEGISFNVNFNTGYIGTIGKNITNASITLNDNDHITLEYTEGGNVNEFEFAREGTLPEGSKTIYNGTWMSGTRKLILNQGERENKTCGHYIISHIITSYMDQSSSINPSKNVMTYYLNKDGGFTFAGEKVHTRFRVDNYPYYPDYSAHPELGEEWDADEPTPCYKNEVNAKVNISFVYDKDGWLIKESCTSLGYDYNAARDDQISLVATYTYKFGD